MGGAGSGRWANHTKKTTVESCLFLSTKPLRNALAYGPGWSGTVSWSRNGEPFAWLSYTTESLEEGLAVRLQYSSGSGETWNPADYLVQTASSPARLGGLRWFFLCPLLVNGTPCGRRVAKLYLPPGHLRFGCRPCYNLTYASAQESPRFDGLYTLLATQMGRGFTAERVKAAFGRIATQ
jgi:hypothetical protein